MDINDLVLSDEALNIIDKGEWVPAGEEAPGVEFLVTGMQAEGARKLIKQKQAQARAKNKGQPLSDDQLAEITKEVLVEEVLRGWRGITHNGEPLEYSKERARQYIMSRGGERFTMLVLNAAMSLDRNANAYVEGLAKN